MRLLGFCPYCRHDRSPRSRGGQRSPPSKMDSLWATSGPHNLGSIVPTRGCKTFAVDPVDGDQTYREMYASVAQQWLAEGDTLHFVKVFASDEQAVETWFSLGFGQVSVQAFRNTNYTHEKVTGIEVVPARAEHIQMLVQLQSEHHRYESETPMFIPFQSASPDMVEARQEEMQALLRDPDRRYWVAFQNGNPAGMMSLGPAASSGLSPLLEMTRMACAEDALTGEAARDPNVRGILLDTALNWARVRDTTFWTSTRLTGRCGPSGGRAPHTPVHGGPAFRWGQGSEGPLPW